jgi:hypothetical protein
MFRDNLIGLISKGQAVQEEFFVDIDLPNKANPSYVTWNLSAFNQQIRDEKSAFKHV